MAEQARGDDVQRESQVALIGKVGGGVGERIRLSPGQQVEGRRCFFRAARVEPLSVRLPVAGAVARVTTVFRSAPGQLAASFSDPRRRLREIGSVMVIAFRARVTGSAA